VADRRRTAAFKTRAAFIGVHKKQGRNIAQLGFSFYALLAKNEVWVLRTTTCKVLQILSQNKIVANDHVCKLRFFGEYFL